MYLNEFRIMRNKMHINAGHEQQRIFCKKPLKAWHDNAWKTTYHQLENTVIHQQG